ncbi:MAG: hypothetical protein AAGE38_04050 [Pseudomonadota bacterium]
MRVLENSYARLVLSHRPWKLWVFFCALALTCLVTIVTDPANSLPSKVTAVLVGVAALGGILWATPMTTIVLDRPSGGLMIETVGPLGRRVRALPLSDITWAQVDTTLTGNSRGSRLTVVIDGKRVPLERSSGPGDRRTAETAINEWLTRPDIASDQSPQR